MEALRPKMKPLTTTVTTGAIPTATTTIIIIIPGLDWVGDRALYCYGNLSLQALGEQNHHPHHPHPHHLHLHHHLKQHHLQAPEVLVLLISPLVAPKGSIPCHGWHRVIPKI